MSVNEDLEKFQDTLTGIIASGRDWKQAYQAFIMENWEIKDSGISWKHGLQLLDNHGRLKK